MLSSPRSVFLLVNECRFLTVALELRGGVLTPCVPGGLVDFRLVITNVSEGFLCVLNSREGKPCRSVLLLSEMKHSRHKFV